MGCCPRQEQHTYKDDCLCAPVELQPIKIGSAKLAFVVLKGNRELGTILQHAPKAAWSVYKGIGGDASFAGTFATKKEAIDELA
jgi:hypothetical protein